MGQRTWVEELVFRQKRGELTDAEVDEVRSCIEDLEGRDLLTPGEQQELEALRGIVNQPKTTVLPPAHAHREQTDVLARIGAIPWFSRCGQPFKSTVELPVHPMNGWKRALEANASRSWENALLEAQNQLSVWLAVNRHSSMDWNRVVKDFKDGSVALLDAGLAEQPLQKQHRSSMEWYLCLAYLENHYLPRKHPCCFGTQLLEILEVGHWPCGWKGRYPAGNLLVF